MTHYGKEATDFVRACEAIHSVLGEKSLTPDDRDLIEFSGAELLSALRLMNGSHLPHPGTPLPAERSPAHPMDCATQ